ncbi:MAG: hypothetical protein RR280_10615, partial [Bacteroidaceae bacterium]
QAKFVWLVKKTTNGNIATYSFQNLLTSGFLPVPIDNNTPVKTVNNTAQNKGAFSIECKSSAFYITQNNNTTKDNYGFNGHGSTFLFWTPGSAAGDPSHAIAFYPCTVSEGVLYTVTTKMREENSTTEFETRTEEMLSGEIYNAPAVDLKKVVSTDPANVNGTVLNLTTDKTIIAYYKYDPTKLPFTTTTVANNAFAPVTKWYNFRLNTNETQGYCLYDDVTKEILSNKGQANVQGVAAGLFAFAGDPINGFDIYNKSTGTASKLGDRITDHASMVAAESGIKWYLVRNDEPGWNLSKLKTPSGNCYLNRRTSYVGYYNSTSDNGSRCGFEINTYDITINATGYATFSADVATTIPTGVTAYIAKKTAGASTLTLTALPASSILPANTGVILKGTANTTYSFVKSTGTPATIGTNELKATSETPVQADAKKSYYVLNNGGSSVNLIGFYKAKSASVIPANKAYYIGTGANSLLFEGDDLT